MRARMARAIGRSVSGVGFWRARREAVPSSAEARDEPGTQDAREVRGRPIARPRVAPGSGGHDRRDPFTDRTPADRNSIGSAAARAPRRSWAARRRRGAAGSTAAAGAGNTSGCGASSPSRPGRPSAAGPKPVCGRSWCDPPPGLTPETAQSPASLLRISTAPRPFVYSTVGRLAISSNGTNGISGEHLLFDRVMVRVVPVVLVRTIPLHVRPERLAKVFRLEYRCEEKPFVVSASVWEGEAPAEPPSQARQEPRPPTRIHRPFA